MVNGSIGIKNQTESRQSTKERIASLTSNILNPFLISLGVVLSFSFTSTTSTAEALKWTLITAAVGILPIFLVVIYLLRRGGIDDFFTSVRQQRTKIYIAAGFSAVAGYVLLTAMGAPPLLVGGFTTLLSMAAVFMFINIWWKISVHTGCIAASSLVLVMLHGWTAAATVPLVPLTAWARIELESHSVAQAVSGALLAAVIAAVIFYPIVMA